ncbi:hypothetical protein BaRGS_00025194 [Batillaria attramentaria]|uniref:Uncharacterized protein n=1 Tax=Batillaria attramentaria TaxID=370345 RepID=A0ABD0K8U8_9CAEN
MGKPKAKGRSGPKKVKTVSTVKKVTWAVKPKPKLQRKPAVSSVSKTVRASQSKSRLVRDIQHKGKFYKEEELRSAERRRHVSASVRTTLRV